MQIIVILMAFMAVIALPDGGGLAPLPHWAVLGAVVLYLAVAAALERLIAIWSLRRLNSPVLRADRGPRGQDLLWALAHGYLLGGLVALLLGGLGDLVAWARPAPLLPEALLIAPFAAGLLLAWWMQYPVHLATRTRWTQCPDAVATPVWLRGEFLKYNFRVQFLFVAAPLGLILLLRDAVTLYGWPALTRACRLAAGSPARTGKVWKA